MIFVMQSMIGLLRNRKVIELLSQLHTTATFEAARKGTREKARLKKVKVEVKKVGFIPHNQREDKIKVVRRNRHIDDTWKRTPIDNVYAGRFYRWAVYTVPEAIKCHRETHHPSMCNAPNASLIVAVELNMQGEKKTRFVDKFSRIVSVPHPFHMKEDRTILVFVKGNEFITEATEAGATLAGGTDLIKQITKGELLLDKYKYILAHPNILPELVSLRGLLNRGTFPSPRNETLDPNLAEMIKKFRYGIDYTAFRDNHQNDFGFIRTRIGTLDMDIEHLEDNLRCLLVDINSKRPRREGRFITRVMLKSPPTREQLKIDPYVYIPENYERATANGNASVEDAATDADELQLKKVGN